MGIFYNTDRLPPFRNAVLTIGTFDGVHLGHKTILNEVVQHTIKEGGESVLITFEPHPRKLLHPDQPLRMLTPLDQKIALISEAGIQHIVVAPFTKEFSQLSAKEYISEFLVKHFHPKSIVIGYDHHFGHDRTGDISLLKQLEDEYDYRVFEITAQLIQDAAVSSTKIRQAVEQGRVSNAADMLGRYYSLSGKVVKGAQVGRTMGFPTANIQPSEPEQLLPAKGVYAVLVVHDGKEYKAMLNIGFRPTVNDPVPSLHIEANLLDFDGNLYDKALEVKFVHFLREEQKFPSLEALKEQLGKDRELAMKALVQ
jgi:riboflavin kinase/FMN adenylyltransferase